MNYYEHHLGDYAEATAHLTFVEDAAYSRLLRKYYSTEAPIPSDLQAAQRLVAARTKEEREAVQVVLEEFFDLREDGWHNKRADEVIAAYLEKQIDSGAKRENEAERQRRHRARRRELFEALRSHGQVPKFDTPTSDLERMLSRVTGTDSHASPVTPVTRDATATHSPVTIHQKPEDQKLPPSGGGEAGKPATPPADLAKRRQERVKQITEDARQAFNAALGKPNGLLPSVQLLTDVRVKQVKRCLSVASAICQRLYGSERVTPEFWAEYFGTAEADDFHAGRVAGGAGHENWTPDFEYLTRADVMAKLFDRAMADEPPAAGAQV
jgi:uncharacterized protein YdaU (DUF1376 family)